MKRFVALGTLAIFFFSLAPTRGNDPPHLEFVRGMRAQQLADYALQYLLKLNEKPPPGLEQILPLELAKTRMDLAQLESNETRKLTQYTQARAELQAFLAKNPKHPLAAEANLDMARLVALQGKGQLSKARRQETTESEKAELFKARGQFEEAGRQLKAAGDRIEAQLAAYASPKTPEEQKAKQILNRARLQAKLEQGINLLDQASAYHEGESVAELQKRGKLVKAAMTILADLAKEDDKNPLCWQARVWLGRAHQENEDPTKAREAYGKVIAEESEAARAANRLARYFRMLVIQNDPNEKDPQTKIKQSAEQWLKNYPNYLTTPEGYGVRFELANVYYRQGMALTKGTQVSPKAKDLLTQAQRQFQILEQSKNDFSEQARRRRLEIILLTSQDVSKGTVEKLKNFDECFLRAQVEIAKMNQMAKKDLPEEKAKEQRKEHFLTMINALSRGLTLTDTKTAPEDKADARFLLTYSYLASGDPYRAAVVGEELARTDPKASRAPQAATYALYAYSQVIQEERQAGGLAEQLEGHRNRIRNLAEYIEKTWPEESAADDARFQLGLLLLQGKKYAETVEVLERITPSYGESIRALYHLATSAFQAQRENSPVPKGKPSFEERGTRALKAVPELPPGADPATTEIYFLARLELSRIHYGEKKYAEMQALLDKLTKQLEQAKEIDQEARTGLATTIRARKLLARYGLAEEDYAKGEYEKVEKELAPLVKELDTPEKIKEAAGGNDPRFVYALMGLAVRANVQGNKIDGAKEILDVLEKGDPENSRQVLVQIVFQLEKQLQALKSQEGEDAKKQLEATTANFTSFLSELGKKTNLAPETNFFLAQSYTTLEKHKEAGELLAKIPEPKAFKVAEPRGPGEPPDPENKAATEAYKKLSEAHDKEMAAYRKQLDGYRRELQIYRASRILLMRALRLTKDFKRAQAEADLVGKQQWSQTNMEFQKERIYILEDQGFYGGKAGAVTAWYTLMDRMKNELSNPRVKEQYFDCYLSFTRCMYLNANNIKDVKKKQASIQSTAQSIVNLRRAIEERRKLDAKEGKPNPEMDKVEDVAWKKFMEYLSKEAPLKQAYEQALQAN